ncbi:uncharacterized protein LOC141632369 [Silene latifolia]|uniref:uncharacterized protein LOC141632369 n=1 Tax=Silene latifolia TaxID=37657 RepID=UPI003D774282
MTNVLRLGPWKIGNNSLILKQWTPSFSGEMEKVTRVLVWTLFSGLDPYLWSEIVLSKIASKVDKPLFADLSTTNKEKLSFARVLVEIDLSQDFVDSVVINTPFLGQITQQEDTNPIVAPPVVESASYDADPILDGTFTEFFGPSEGAICSSSSSKDPLLEVLPLMNQFQLLEQGEIQQDFEQEQHVSQELGDSLDLHLSMVYGSNDAQERHRLWSGSADVSSAEPWLVLGDFNVVRQPSEKLSNTPPVLQEMVEFNDYLAFSKLDNLTSSGCDMTWNNEQDLNSTVWSKVNRVLANPDWLASLPDSFALFQEAGLSDHSPLLVHVNNDRKRMKRFSFLNSWIDHPAYLATVAAAWTTEKKGSPMFSLFEKLKSVKYALTKFHKENFNNISLRVKNAKTALVECQRMLIADPFSADLIHKEKMLLASYSHLKESELKILYQRAKVSERQHQQVIGAIKDQKGQLHTDFPSVNQAFQNYYQHLLGTSFEVADLDWDFISSGTTVTSYGSTDLTKDITTKEIRNVVFRMDSNSNPGLDGFSAGFFKSAWPIIAQDFCKAVAHFFHSNHMSKQANSTLISLIPKKATPSAVTDYRHISCCTVFYKIVSKILDNRIQSVLPSLVGPEQAAFVKNINIFENIMLSQTLVKGYNRSNISPKCLIKVDIKKAFDSLQWNFIANMLKGFGFAQKFADWALGCITSPWHLRTLCTHPNVSHHPKCSRINLTHLIFADDLMIFTRGDAPSVQVIQKVLQQFVGFSGLHANIEKTNIYFGGVHSDIKATILAATGFS